MLNEKQGNGWHPEDIKAALRKRGLSLAEVGRRVGRERSTVAKVVAGARSRRIEGAIAKALGVKRSVLWPSRYMAAPVSVIPPAQEGDAA